MSKLLFLLGCIPVRLLMVCFAYYMLNIPEIYKNPLFYLFLSVTFVIGMGFWTIYVMGWRKTGLEVGGKEIWWNHLRPVHGTNYLLFTLFAAMGWKHAWLFLLLDVGIGVGAFFRRYS